MIGKAGTAPCGHPGEHLTTNYVRCGRGCDAAGAGELSDGVPDQVFIDRTSPICPFVCAGGEMVKWDDEWRKNDLDYWLCRGCGRSFYA